MEEAIIPETIRDMQEFNLKLIVPGQVLPFVISLTGPGSLLPKLPDESE